MKVVLILFVVLIVVIVLVGTVLCSLPSDTYNKLYKKYFPDNK